MITYPSAEDYIIAVQQPDAFRTAALRAAVFSRHRTLQVPVPAAGSAAVVFRATVNGTERALRFLTRDDASSRERYTALGRHFVEQDLTSCVATSSWRDGAISIGGRAWPVIEMQWVEGRTLDAYVQHLVEAGDQATLGRLAAAWRELVARLQRAEFAHGDLQHGNVLVDSTGSLRLVDFDGSWIDEFSGDRAPRETGHSNYQRPDREWGRHMDTFPGLVVYVALLALACAPTLWEAFHNGENLLFSADDLQPPFATEAWAAVAAIGDPELDRMTMLLQRCCEPSWEAQSDLETLLSETSPAVSGNSTAETPWWVKVADKSVPQVASGVAAPVPPKGRAPSLPKPPAKTSTVPPVLPSPATPSQMNWFEQLGEPEAEEAVEAAAEHETESNPSGRRRGASTTLIPIIVVMAALLGWAALVLLLPGHSLDDPSAGVAGVVSAGVALVGMIIALARRRRR